jgi:geranylgeranyl diphosphate synthase type II
MEGGGKRIRPVLLLMACNAFSESIEHAMPCAGAIEMFHTFTLLHDDIMDNAEMRRGKAAVHKHWNSNTAILSGDAMVICSYRLLQQAPPELLPAVMSEFNKLAIEVCEGQQYDIDFESREDVGLDEYMDMIRLKTAVLIGGAVKIGGILGRAGERNCELLYRFGIELGMAFQLQDDYLDTYGTPETLGKNIGGDIADSKKTFLTITALAEAGEATRRAVLATFKDDTHPLEHKINRIKTIYNSLDVPEITLAAINKRLADASAALDQMDIDPARTVHLKEFIEAIRNRNK